METLDIEEYENDTTYTFTYDSEDDLYKAIINNTYDIDSLTDDEEIRMHCMIIRGVVDLAEQLKDLKNKE